MGRALSVVIVVRDRRDEIEECLSSLSTQKGAPDFEVLVVDDGSRDRLEIDENPAFPLIILCQAPMGIACARNLGLRHASGDVTLFIDSDCLAAPDLLARVAEGAERHPDDVAFQAHLQGRDTTLAASVEHLRLQAIQEATLQPSGHIRYANTSGLALRMSHFCGDRDVFDPGQIRGEDTSLLDALYDEGRIPRYLPEAKVFHCPRTPLWRYAKKRFWVGYHTAAVRRRIARKHSIGRAADLDAGSALADLERAQRTSVGVSPRDAVVLVRTRGAGRRPNRRNATWARRGAVLPRRSSAVP